MFIEEIKEEERTLGDKFDEFSKKLGKLCDEGYDILGDKELKETERNAFIDILAGIKGAKMATYKLMEAYSDTPAADRKKVDEKADEFLNGLGLGDFEPEIEPKEAEKSEEIKK